MAEVGVARRCRWASEQPPPDQPVSTSRFVFAGVAVSVTLVPGVACRALRTAASGVGAIDWWAAATRWYRRRRR
jgi:hypothetical protein